ncbi:GntR family transcriptional regulator [Dactylosporangium sp. CA-092794]|uniref:GntR family transcriptional regulator n=1 Tax=Dactylosporangium sp. CA-092794 TaxID=3239929 RepID=UPI003D8D180B
MFERDHAIGAGPPRRMQLNDEAADYVRELIMTGQLRPGDFIRLDDIARRLGVSTTPVREGLLALRGDGFVRLEARRGFVVAPLSIKDIRDVFVAQGTLAGELAARAAATMAPAGHAHLAELQEALEAAAAAGEIGRLEALNHAFHRHINRAADAPKIAWLLSVGARYVPRRFYATITGWPDASARDHAAIIAALASGDADGARQSMSRHVSHAGELLARHLERADRPGTTTPPGATS